MGWEVGVAGCGARLFQAEDGIGDGAVTGVQTCALPISIGVPILTNSSIQLLLKQSPTTIDLVQQTFHLTDEEKYLLLESGVGEGLFFAGLKHVAIKIYASYTEDQIVSSDPAQMLAIARSKQELATAGG